ncbi:MAG: pyrroline-5-carboxylate reductase [Parasphingorhabdus sp.]
MNATLQWPETIWVIGCGNMGGSIVQAWLNHGAPAENITIIDPSPSRLPEGLTARTDFPKGDSPAMVLLSVKPHMLGDVASELAQHCSAKTTLISILAGTELGVLDGAFPDCGTIVRLMPNMAVTVGKSPMIMVSRSDDSDLKTQMNHLFSPLGSPEWLANEEQMHLATALSGSGPAFLFRFIDALTVSAVELGMDHSQAARLALGMVEGAAELAANAEDSPGILADRVASPGGVTRKGLDVLDADSRINLLLRDVLKAAMERNREMAKEAKS